MAAAASSNAVSSDRLALEQRFIADLRPIFAAQFDRARRNPTAIPYGQFQQELVSVITRNLLEAFQSAGAALIVGHSLAISQGAFEQVGRQWAHGYALELAAQTVNASRYLAAVAVDRVMHTARAADRQQQLDLALSLIFLADQRLENLAITEITRGISQGENAVVLVFPEQRRDRLIPIWQCVEAAPGIPDARVCVICAPFDRRSNEVWGREFPDGPPAHPRCRCRRVWMPASEWGRRAA